MFTLTLDPSINETGWATDAQAGGASGVIKTHGKTDAEKLLSLSEGLQTLCVSFQPHVVVVEVPAAFTYTRSQNKWSGKGMNTEALLKLSRAVGVCLLIAKANAREVIEIKAHEWKGRAGKDVARLITGKKNHNEADAVMLLQWFNARR